MITTQTTLEEVFKIMTDRNVDTINIDYNNNDKHERKKIKRKVMIDG